jgi:predicted ATPase
MTTSIAAGAHRTSILPMQRRCRIALTGGPGGGKTTAADLFRRELGESVVVVPESATILFAGGFPRSDQVDAGRAVQTAIFHVQRNLEDVQSARYPERALICDRGTIDGAAYWPEGDGDFFERMGTTFETELQRYDAVVFFETAAVAGDSIEGGNPVRNESLDQAVALDARLRRLWARHPRFSLVPHSASFLHKITTGLALLQSIVEQARR